MRKPTSRSTAGKLLALVLALCASWTQAVAGDLEKRIAIGCVLDAQVTPGAYASCVNQYLTDAQIDACLSADCFGLSAAFYRFWRNAITEDTSPRPMDAVSW